jgi:hypothetical protein
MCNTIAMIRLAQDDPHGSYCSSAVTASPNPESVLRLAQCLAAHWSPCVAAFIGTSGPSSGRSRKPTGTRSLRLAQRQMCARDHGLVSCQSSGPWRVRGEGQDTVPAVPRTALPEESMLR